jgi:hypothetical protein
MGKFRWISNISRLRAENFTVRNCAEYKNQVISTIFEETVNHNKIVTPSTIPFIAGVPHFLDIEQYARGEWERRCVFFLSSEDGKAGLISVEDCALRQQRQT